MPVISNYISYIDKFMLYLRILNNYYIYIGNIIGLGPLSPQGSCASSGSEGRLDDASNRSLASGMRGRFKYNFNIMLQSIACKMTERSYIFYGVLKYLCILYKYVSLNYGVLITFFFRNYFWLIILSPSRVESLSNYNFFYI